MARISGLQIAERELRGQTGVPAELLSVIRVAMGFARPEPDDRVREDEMEVVPLVRLQHENGFRTMVIGLEARFDGIDERFYGLQETLRDQFRSHTQTTIWAMTALTGIFSAIVVILR